MRQADRGQPVDMQEFRGLIESLRTEVAPFRSVADPTILPRSVADALTALDQALATLRLSYDEEQGKTRGRGKGALSTAGRNEWRALVDLAADAYVLTDVKGVIRDANRVATGLFGITHSELVGQSLVAFLPAEERESFAARLLHSLASGEKQEVEMRLVSRTPRGLFTFVTLARLAPSIPGQTDITWVIHDLTPRRRVEEALRAALEMVRLGEQRLDAALRLAPVTLLTTDNQLHHKLIHGPHLDGELEALLSSGSNHVPAPQGVADLLDFERAVLDSQVGARGEVSLNALGGEPVYYDVTAELLRDSAGEVVGLSVLLWDATERKLASEALREARSELTREVAELQLAMQQSAMDLESSRQKARELGSRLVEVQEQERRAIARELHDEAGQVLTALILGLAAIEKEAGPSQDISARVAELKQMTESAMEALHHVAGQLRPISLDRLGLVPAITQQVESVRQRAKLSVGLAFVALEGVRLSTTVETVTYRIVQEALTNIVRHASAQHAGVVVERQGSVVKAIIEDDGVGFDPEAAMRSGRLGLAGMRERVEMIGGSLTIESAPGRGTTVFAEIPCAG